MAVTEASTGRTGRSIYRDILQGSGFYSLPLIAQRMVGFILLPLYTRVLTPSDYGTMELMDQVVGLATLLLGGNFSSALSYFYFQSESEEWRKRTVSTTILGSILLGAGCAALGFSASVPISRALFGTSDNARYLQILFAGVVAAFPLEAVFCWLRTANAAGLYAAGSIVRLALTAGLTVTLMLGVGWRLAAVVSSPPLVGALGLIVLLPMCWSRLGGLPFDKELFGKLFRYTAPMALTSLALFVLHFGDRFVLKHYTTLDQIGIYSMSYKLGMLVAFVAGTFSSYWSAQIYNILKRPDGGQVITRVFTYMNIALLMVVIGITVFARPALRVLTTPAFYSAWALAPVIALAYYLRAVGDFFRALFYVRARSGVDAIVNWLGAGVCAVGYFIMIPLWGVWGAAIATVVAFLFLLILASIWAYRVLPYRIEAARLAKVGIAAAVPLTASYLCRPQTLLGELGLGMALCLLFPALLTMLRFPTAGEWRQVLSLPSRLGWRGGL